MDKCKRCRKCDEVKTLEDFHRKTSSVDGRQPYCRVCNSREAAKRKAARLADDPKFREHIRVYRATYYRDHREEQKSDAKAWRAANPERVALALARYVEQHPDRRRETHRAYRQRNLEKRSAAFRAWSKANPENARARQHRRRALQAANQSIPYTVEQLEARFAMFGGNCWMCGKTGNTIDHVKPIGRGGADILANLRPACSRDNSAKRDRWFGVAELHRFIR